MIIRVRVSTQDTKKSGNYENTVVTPRQVFEDLEVRMGNNVTMNAQTLSAAQLDTPIGELTGATDVLLASIVKADGAC